MFMLWDDLQIGGVADCQRSGPGLAVVHTCKYPYHAAAVGYTGSLPKAHRYYLALEHSGDLYLNLIDPPQPLFQVESFTAFWILRIDTGRGATSF
ncbi:MAG: hypothetical protein R3C14_02885 [Caldilineaceae bacterium]